MTDHACRESSRRLLGPASQPIEYQCALCDVAQLASKCMASKTIIGSFVRLWVLTRLGIRGRPQSKIHHRGSHPLERGSQDDTQLIDVWMGLLLFHAQSVRRHTPCFKGSLRHLAVSWMCT